MSRTTTLDPPPEYPPMTMGYFRIILRCFGDTPARRAAVLEGTGVTEAVLGDTLAHIDLFQQLRQIDNVNALVGEGWVPATPDLWNHSSHGALGVAAMTSADLAGALAIVARYSHVRSSFTRVRLHRGSGHAPEHVNVKFNLSVALAEPQWRPIVEIGMLGLHSVVSAIAGPSPAGAVYGFACREPAHGADLGKVLGGEVRYNSASNSVRLPADILALRSPYADPGLHSHAIAELDRARQSLNDPLGVRSRVERLLATMPAVRFGSDDMARALGLSRRTLVRRLAEAGVGYRELLDLEMKRRAREFLDAGALSNAEIGERLGYADPTSFSRACRRWFPDRSRRGAR